MRPQAAILSHPERAMRRATLMKYYHMGSGRRNFASYSMMVASCHHYLSMLSSMIWDVQVSLTEATMSILIINKTGCHLTPGTSGSFAGPGYWAKDPTVFRIYIQFLKVVLQLQVIVYLLRKGNRRALDGPVGRWQWHWRQRTIEFTNFACCRDRNIPRHNLNRHGMMA